MHPVTPSRALFPEQRYRRFSNYHGLAASANLPRGAMFTDVPVPGGARDQIETGSTLIDPRGSGEHNNHRRPGGLRGIRPHPIHARRFTTMNAVATERLVSADSHV